MTQPTPEVSTEAVVEVALESFATKGFEDTRLDTIAAESGMSKRMIHYHFGDKKGLYIKALQLAITQLRPEQQDMEMDSTVPAEGILRIVDAIYRRMILYPNATRMIALESLFGAGGMKERAALADQSVILLQMDKILMMGQDSGAFRPGISAIDVYTIISSLCMFRIANRSTFVNLYDTDFLAEDNVDGMGELIGDVVLSFLTSTLPSREHMSYLTQHPHVSQSSDANSIYND